MSIEDSEKVSMMYAITKIIIFVASLQMLHTLKDSKVCIHCKSFEHTALFQTDYILQKWSLSGK